MWGNRMNYRVVLTASAAALAIGLCGHASAQNVPAETQAQPEILVTGSRIKAPNLTSTSPLLSLSDKDVAVRGTTNVENLLNTLPQVSASNSSAQSTFGTPGIATVNLRNLGPARTQVMIDGRRLMPGDPLAPYADLNFIPAALISSVEVLTGGASTAYGSDAVAGVVNFKMKRNLKGFLVDYQFSADQHDNNNAAAQQKLRDFGVKVPGNKFDGFTHNATIAFGANTADGRGNITAYVGYRHTDPVGDADRDLPPATMAPPPSRSLSTPMPARAPAPAPMAGSAPAARAVVWPPIPTARPASCPTPDRWPTIRRRRSISSAPTSVTPQALSPITPSAPPSKPMPM
jgi:outer membrane receptor protein involved in Fe transport